MNQIQSNFTTQKEGQKKENERKLYANYNHIQQLLLLQIRTSKNRFQHVL